MTWWTLAEQLGGAFESHVSEFHTQCYISGYMYGTITKYTNLVHNDSNDILTNVKERLEEIPFSDINEITQSDINELWPRSSNISQIWQTTRLVKYVEVRNISKMKTLNLCWIENINRNNSHKARKRYSYLKNAENRRKMCTAKSTMQHLTNLIPTKSS